LILYYQIKKPAHPGWFFYKKPSLLNMEGRGDGGSTNDSKDKWSLAQEVPSDEIAREKFEVQLGQKQ